MFDRKPKSTKYIRNHAVARWIIAATGGEIHRISEIAGISVAYFHHLAWGYRQPSAELAGALSEASKELHKVSGGRTPILLRSELCGACYKCPHSPKSGE